MGMELMWSLCQQDIYAVIEGLDRVGLVQRSHEAVGWVVRHYRGVCVPARRERLYLRVYLLQLPDCLLSTHAPLDR